MTNKSKIIVNELNYLRDLEKEMIELCDKDPENNFLSVENYNYNEDKLECTTAMFSNENFNVPKENRTVIKTDFEYDENGDNTKITSYKVNSGETLKILPGKKAKRNLTCTEIDYDDNHRIVQIDKDNLVTDTFSYTKTGKCTHVNYYDYNGGMITDTSVFDKDENLISRKVVTGSDVILYKYYKSLRRGIYTEFEFDRNKNTTQKTTYKIENGNQILLSRSIEIKGAKDVSLFSDIKKIYSYEYDENNILTFVYLQEINDNIHYNTTYKMKYKRGKLFSVLDITHNRIVKEFIKKGRYNIEIDHPLTLFSSTDINIEGIYDKAKIYVKHNTISQGLVVDRHTDKYNFIYEIYRDQHPFNKMTERVLFKDNGLEFIIEKTCGDKIPTVYNLNIRRYFKDSLITEMNIKTNKDTFYNDIYTKIMIDYKYAQLLNKIKNDIIKSYGSK